MAKAKATVRYRDIQGFPGYRVGDDGSIWSRRPINGQGPLRPEWRQMAPSRQDKGRNYLYVSLSSGDAKQHSRTVHRIVLEAFVGMRPKGMQCCHFPDRSPANNSLGNLRWDTPKANQADSAKHGTHACGERLSNSKLTDDKVRKIRSEYRRGLADALAKRYGVSDVLICLIVNRRAWKHVE